MSAAAIIGFAGLTHLGLCSAVAAAAKGFSVVAWHPDTDVVVRIERGELPVVEPDLDDLFATHHGRLRFSSDPAVLKTCDVVYIAYDVPTDERGASDLGPIDALIVSLAPVLAPRASLVLLCQVPPGYTRARAFPPERLFYQVETLIFGRAMDRALRPERFIIGCANPQAPLPSTYHAFLTAFDCPLLPMRYESAELAKIAINCFLVASVTTTNMLAELAAAIQADWSEIVPALRLDARIGPKAYLNPGLGIAGGNLERDLATVHQLGRHHGTDVQVLEAWIGNSAHARDWASRTLSAVVLANKPDARIGVLGLAYKENTASVKNSASLALLEQLEGRALRVYDPAVPAGVAPWAERVSSPLAAAESTDALLILTPWPEFRDLDPAALAGVMAGRVVIDPYHVLDPAAVARAGLSHYTLGRPARLAKAPAHA